MENKEQTVKITSEALALSKAICDSYEKEVDRELVQADIAWLFSVADSQRAREDKLRLLDSSSSQTPDLRS